MSLGELRREIDQIDDRIVELLNQRAVLAVQIGRIKQASGENLYVPARERDVLNRMIARNRGPVSHAAVCAIYGEIMASALSLEHHDLVVAGGGSEADLAAALAYVAGGNAEMQFHASDSAMLDAFAAADDAVLICPDEWFVKQAGGRLAAMSNARWRGFWSVPLPADRVVRFHMLGKNANAADNLVPKPLTLMCVVDLTASGIPASREWLDRLPARSAVLYPPVAAGDSGLLKIKLEAMSTKDAVSLIEGLSGSVRAAWLA